MPELVLNVPWLVEQRLGHLAVHYGIESYVSFDDGVTLAVEVIEPSGFDTIEHLIEQAQAAMRPGSVVLVAGAIPKEWRPSLRSQYISFIDTSGVGFIDWPRVSFESGQFASRAERVRRGLPLQKSHATVVQSLLEHHFHDAEPTMSELAIAASVSLSSASRTVSKLEEYGLARRRADGGSKRVQVVWALELAKLLAERSAWPNGDRLTGYHWGSTIRDVVSRLVDTSSELDGVDVVVTGRAALEHFGVLSTSAPTVARLWVRSVARLPLETLARKLQLEPVPESESNVQLALDRWGLSRQSVFDGHGSISDAVASPLRVWCDIQSEPRGGDFAAQLWPSIDQRGANR